MPMRSPSSSRITFQRKTGQGATAKQNAMKTALQKYETLHIPERILDNTKKIRHSGLRKSSVKEQNMYIF